MAFLFKTLKTSSELKKGNLTNKESPIVFGVDNSIFSSPLTTQKTYTSPVFFYREVKRKNVFVV